MILGCVVYHCDTNYTCAAVVYHHDGSVFGISADSWIRFLLKGMHVHGAGAGKLNMVLHILV